MATERTRLNSEDAMIRKVHTTEKLDEKTLLEAKRVKQQIRANVANVYDLQTLRIAAGNRVVQSFMISMGKASSDTKESIEEKKEVKMLKTLELEFNRVTDGIVALHEGAVVGEFTKADVKRSIKKLQESEDKQELLNYLVDYDSYKLYESYNFLMKAEESAQKTLDGYVKQHPLWDAFFKDIKGCGTLMSAVCIAYLDPYRANHASSFFKYCGLDMVQDEDAEGNKLFITQDGKFRVVRWAYEYLDRMGVPHEGKVRMLGSINSISGEPEYEVDGEICTRSYIYKGADNVYIDIETGEEYIGDVAAKMHGRRKGDTELFEYVDKDGNVKTKRGITYNPKIKTKLMGVLTGCLLKAKDPTYATKYYDHRKRLDNNIYHKETSDGRKNMMAQRYMIKCFLRDLWTTWRNLEGLPVDLPYEVEKLGHTPHRDNIYQCRMAGYTGDVAE